MAVIAAALKHMIAAGMDADAIVDAVADMEACQPHRSKAAERQARYRERNKASQVTVSDDCDGEQKDPFDKETPPVPPKEINIPKKTPPIVPPGFEEFWELYRIKKGRKTAITAFSKAIKRVELRAMLEAVKRYQAVTEQKFQLHPTTWLNQDRWTDDHSEPATGPPQNLRSQEILAELNARDAANGHP